MATIKADAKIAIVGSGLIGQFWAMIFAAGEYRVTIFDIYPEQVTKALENIKATLSRYESEGCLRGNSSAADQAALVTGCNDLGECLKGASYVQECVPESVELKQKVFEQMDPFITEEMVVATSSSCICVSQFVGNLKHKHRTLVAHPVNPPYFIPLVEIVPGPWTPVEVTAKARALLEQVGQSPVTLSREVAGFALNRIQYSIINECWNMYKDGLLTAEDIDRVMTDGLGPRYAFIGPLETMHLNADGIVDYCKRYAQGAYNVCSTFKPPPILYDVPTAEQMLQEIQKTIPVEKVPERRRWRDERLSALAALKKRIVDYCKRYAQGAYNVCSTFKPPPILYDVPTAEQMLQEIQKTIPVEKVPERRRWRDERLSALAALKKSMKEKTE
ncbi:lambda-crystallin-like protein [Plakobranchus ocellatus]|uniref:Lambda-crystallin-like protein n=1 Tax=Plakobranchus ocellatus TaxID=259542 RepID=A0AAV4AZQ5_9GAST|nr:lambda-crystallin-like protein [Plakobranchus ocellatus]